MTNTPPAASVQVVERSVVQAAVAVGTRDYSQGAVVFTAVIQMHAQRDHAFENVSGRMYMWHTGLDGPSEKSGGFDFLAYGDG